MKMKFPTPTALHPTAQGRAGFFTPKALYPIAQGHAAVKPQSAPWVTDQPTHVYAEGVIQMTAPTFHHRHDRETGQRRTRCVTPSAYGMRGAYDHPGCAANDEIVVSRRPWALEYNRFAVKRPWGDTAFFTPKALHPTAQGRAAVKPQSAPWGSAHPTHIYAEGVTQMTAPINPKRNVRRFRCRICDTSGEIRLGRFPSYDVPLGWQCTV